ncbi:sugar isomerase domain-containing protein [Exiguobacterium sp. MER 193]|nr:sugar isomerase domain-containing protein [Exiguobacterium sp. MER 193]MCM3281711.1 sugar isomerase domain-containing protein [Exiguobacterium sp. MER 193]
MLDTRPVTKTSDLESLEGYGRVLAKHVPFQAGDILLAHSVSGRNPVMIDLVTAAKERGVKIIAITNKTYSMETTSRHSSGMRLYELADVTFDNHGRTGDATVYIEPLDQYIAPTSTVIGATIVNMLLVEVVEGLLEHDIEPPIFYSANLDGTAEKNKEMLSKNQTRIHYM